MTGSVAIDGPDHAVIEVADTMVGRSTEELARDFDRLWRADAPTLAIDIEKAQGFLVLLQSQELAFMALTDGNILDACFGTPPFIHGVSI